MADYKELLRRAIAALPENNGAARRAVYEKARSALVGQLRAINPPLPARDITQHRLQLEDCIRQVEQEASEAVIAGLSQQYEEARPTPPPPPAPKPAPKPVETKAAAPLTFDRKDKAEGGSIEELIAASEAEEEVVPAKPARPAETKPMLRAVESVPEPAADEGAPAPESKPVPSIVARAEAAKNGTLAFGIPTGKPYEKQMKGPTLEPRRESRQTASAAQAAPRMDPVVMPKLSVRPQVSGPLAMAGQPGVATAMSSVREVEVEDVQSGDPQTAIDRAIATLDREARGEATPVVAEPTSTIQPFEDERSRQPMFSMPGKRKKTETAFREVPSALDGPAFARPKAVRERSAGGGNALTIFLIVFVVLLLGAGGAGFWAWREGYINLEAMFASKAPAPEETQTATTPAGVPAETTSPVAPVTEPAVQAAEQLAVPDNAVTPATDAAVPGNDRLVPEEQLTEDPATAAVEPLALQPTGEENKTEERLTAATGADAAATPSVDPAQIAGSQSLLLEASTDGTTGAVPFSGTVEWSRGTDEVGQPTLIGKANIPARNLSVDVLIRKNSDPSLPASHLMEINFNVTETFVGGSITQLPGVLLKNEELVQGQPLVGASARVVGNSFLFALSASPGDAAANQELLTSRKWIDFALIYGTGKRAIITLEKDEKADAMFTEVFAAWGGGSGNG